MMMSDVNDFAAVHPSKDDVAATEALLRTAKRSNHVHDLRRRIVHKRWGSEYEAFGGREVAIWLLEFVNRLPTSLHCHPETDTCLLVVKGAVDVSLLDRCVRLKASEGLVLRKGLYHSLSARRGAIALEAMYPPNRADLLRLNDSCGHEHRADRAHDYDLQASIREFSPDHPLVRFDGHNNASIQQHGRLWSFGSKQFLAATMRPKCGRMVAFSLTTCSCPMIAGETLLTTSSISKDTSFFSVGFPKESIDGDSI